MVQGSNPHRDKRFFFSPTCPDWLWAHPVLCLLAVKWLGLEAEHFY